MVFGIKIGRRRTKHTEKGKVAAGLRSTGHTPQHPRAVSQAEARQYNIPATCRSGPRGYCTVHTGAKWHISGTKKSVAQTPRRVVRTR